MECADLMTRFKNGEGPGATKGDGYLVRFTQSVHHYATGEGTESATFDRQIDEMRKFHKDLGPLLVPRKRTTIRKRATQ
jgi:hypothetical protein